MPKLPISLTQLAVCFHPLSTREPDFTRYLHRAHLVAELGAEVRVGAVVAQGVADLTI